MIDTPVKIYFALLLLILALGRSANAGVWIDLNTWDAQWEEKYSHWIENDLKTDIFVKGKYQNFTTDCADAVYIVRAIFAFENRLPFVMLDPSGGSAKITNRMKRFDNADTKWDRFHQFADFISSVGSTKSLPNDTYPVAISRQFVRPGAVWSRPLLTKQNAWQIISGEAVEDEPGHAEIVRTVGPDGSVTLLGSKLPGAVRSLIWNPFLVFIPVEKRTGFRQWMQPDWYGKDKTKFPGYSLEQFKMGKDPETQVRKFSTWQNEVKAKLSQPAVSEQN